MKRRLVFRYADYEDADQEKVREMERLVVKHDGQVLLSKASAADNEAVIVCRVLVDEVALLMAEAAANGWSCD